MLSHMVVTSSSIEKSVEYGFIHKPGNTDIYVHALLCGRWNGLNDANCQHYSEPCVMCTPCICHAMNNRYHYNYNVIMNLVECQLNRTVRGCGLQVNTEVSSCQWTQGKVRDPVCYHTWDHRHTTLMARLLDYCAVWLYSYSRGYTCMYMYMCM